MSEPRTEAGRALVDAIGGGQAATLRILTYVLAIEAEAVSTIRSEAGPLDVERLARAHNNTVMLTGEGHGMSMAFWNATVAEYARLSEEPG